MTMQLNLTAAIAASLLLALAACNTTAGIGKDVESVGKTVSETANDVAD